MNLASYFIILTGFELQSGVHHALNPDPYRGVFGSDGEKYAKDVKDLIQYGTSGHVAGFIFEAIQVIFKLIQIDVFVLLKCIIQAYPSNPNYSVIFAGSRWNR